MFVTRKIIEDPQDVIPIPLEFRHRRTEVISIALDSSPQTDKPSTTTPSLLSLAGCWEGETL